MPTKLTSPPPNPGEPQQTAFSQYDYATGLLTGFKDRNGIITQSLYNDPFDRPTLVKVGLGTAVENHTAMYYAGLNPVTVYGVTLTNNDVLTAKDQVAMDDGNLRGWTHTDGFGRTLDQFARDLQGDVRVTTSYDGLGRAKRVSNPYRSTSDPTYGYTDTSYDLLGRVIRVESFDGGGTSSGAVTSEYNGARVLVTDQAGKQRLSQSDGLGRLLEVWEIRTADAATEAVTFPGHAEVTAGYRSRYSYDGLDDLLTVKQQVGTSGTLQTRTFGYDGLKRLVSASNPESGLVQYSYDPNSNLQTKTDARVPAVTTSYVYDALNRVKTRTYSDSTPGVSYGYEKNQSGVVVANAVGRLTFVSSTVSTTSYNQYDGLGRVLQNTQTTAAGTSQSYALNYEYNRAGALTAETYPSLKKYVTSYDSTGRLSEVKEQTQNKTYANTFSYTAHGAVAALTLGNGLVERTAFNTRLQPTQIKLGTAASPASVVQLDYGYGTTSNNGNVVSQTISVPTTGGGTAVMIQSYGYDALNRLQSMSESGGGWTQTYGYDRFGNRWVAAGNVPSPPLTPQTQTAFNPATNKIDPNVMAGYGYDAVGNLTSDPTTAANGIVYDAENRQVSYTRSGVTTSYGYDGDGHRVKKVTSGSPVVTTLYVYDIMGHLVAEYTDATTPPPSNGTKYLTADHLGSTRVVTGQNQNVMARYDYLPYGEEMGAGVGLRTTAMGYGANENTRQKFTAKERDVESGLDYFGARYYSGAQGRFTSVDPAPFKKHQIEDPQEQNRYAYTGNNPLRFIDPDGKDRIEVIVETFIPLNRVTFLGRTFNGNEDRERYEPAVGDTFVEGTFKTQQTVVIETDPSKNGGKPVYGATSENPNGIVGDVGPSHEYDSEGNEIGEGSRASGKTLGGEVIRKDDGSVNVHVYGNEGNPKVSGAPGITYNFDIGVKTNKDGTTTVTISGQHDKFPSYVISAQNKDKPGSKPTAVYSFNSIKAGCGPWQLSPVLRLPDGQKNVESQSAKIP